MVNIKHTFKKEVYIPWAAISDNISLLYTDKKQVQTSDGVICDVRKMEEIHILSVEAVDLIQRLYHLSPWQYLQRWYVVLPSMSSMGFIYMKLEQIKNHETDRTETQTLPIEDN